MQQTIHSLLPKLKLIIIFAVILTFISSCGGGGGGSNNTQPPLPTSQATSFSSSSSSALSLSTSSSSISSSSISSSSSSQESVTLAGTITYDYVPHNLNNIGLNYSATEKRPVRAAVVELLDDTGQVKMTTTTTSDGTYSFLVQKNSQVKIRVKAQLLNNLAPSWNFKVTDNTSNNALYVLDGELASSGSQNSTRNLNAASGWDGVSYSAARSAAPFAILDSIFTGVTRVFAAGNSKSLRPLELRWSTKNSAAEGDLARGEIGTSFYDGSSIYILGDANNDTDEYDPHVLLHEWGHYLERELFRADSIGGDHSDSDLLDFRVAMSEGFANAFSGIVIDNVNYADASGRSQSAGFLVNIGRKNRINKGFFNEGSIGSVLFNYYTSATGKFANDFTPIFKVLSSKNYTENEALTSIFLFYQQLKTQFPQDNALFSGLLQEQAIFGTDEYATGESNSGGLAFTLPVYKIISANNIAVNVCSSATNGKYNKLGNSQFIKLNVAQSGFYTIHVNKSGGDPVISKPEVIVYYRGNSIRYFANTLVDNVSGSVSLAQGDYILEIYDSNNRDSGNIQNNMTCFNARVVAN